MVTCLPKASAASLWDNNDNIAVTLNGNTDFDSNLEICGYLEIVRVLGGFVEGVSCEPLPHLDDVRNVHVHIIFLVVGDFWSGGVS